MSASTCASACTDFPLRHGPNIVVYQPAGRDPRVEAEAELLTLKTRALRLIRMFPGATPSLTEVRAGAVAGTERKQFEDVQLTGRSLEDHIEALLAQRPGLIIVKERSRGLFQRILGIGGRDSRLCNLSPVPVLFADAPASPTSSASSWSSAAAPTTCAPPTWPWIWPRMLSRLPAHAPAHRPARLPGRVREQPGPRRGRHRAAHQPVSGARQHGATGGESGRRARPLRHQDRSVRGGAPQRIRRDSYSTPDVALRMVHAIACSALVISV